MKKTISAYRTRSVPRPMPSRLASQVSIAGKNTDSAAARAKTVSRMRRTAWCRALPAPRMSVSVPTTTAQKSRSWTMMIMGLPVEKIREDVDAVQQGLPFRLGIIGVDDPDRMFHQPRFELGQLLDQLGGMGHAVLAQLDPGGHARGEGAQPVVRIGQLQPGGQPRLQRSRTQHQPLQPGHVRTAGQEPRAQDYVRLPGPDPGEHRLGIADL